MLSEEKSCLLVVCVLKVCLVLLIGCSVAWGVATVLSSINQWRASELSQLRLDTGQSTEPLRCWYETFSRILLPIYRATTNTDCLEKNCCTLVEFQEVQLYKVFFNRESTEHEICYCPALFTIFWPAGLFFPPYFRILSLKRPPI